MARFKITAWLLSVFISLGFASPAGASIDLTDALKQVQHFVIDNDYSGRMLSNALTGQRYTYDRAGRMEGMAQSAVSALYSYDYMGRHVGRVVVGNTTAYGYDALGPIVARYNSDSASVTWRNFGAWGKIINGPPMATDELANGYTGHKHDFESDLIYARARYYDPSFGRFLSKNPVFGALEQPFTINYFVYANANPLTYTDPTGMATDAAFDLLHGTKDLTQEERKQQLQAGAGAGAIFIGGLAVASVAIPAAPIIASVSPEVIAITANPVSVETGADAVELSYDTAMCLSSFVGGTGDPMACAAMASSAADLASLQMSSSGDEATLALTTRGKKKKQKLLEDGGRGEQKSLQSGGNGYSNKEVRQQYKKQDTALAKVDKQLQANGYTLRQRAEKLFRLRNKMRKENQNLMTKSELKKLQASRGAKKNAAENLTFDGFIEDKMRRKNLSYTEALRDTIVTSTQSNPEYDKKSGI